MLKIQHRYDEISADRSIPIPHQPPHLLYFDISTVQDQKENLCCWIFSIYAKLSALLLLLETWSWKMSPMHCNAKLNIYKKSKDCFFLNVEWLLLFCIFNTSSAMDFVKSIQCLQTNLSILCTLWHKFMSKYIYMWYMYCVFGHIAGHLQCKFCLRKFWYKIGIRPFVGT